MFYDFSYLSEVFAEWYDGKFKHYGEHLISTEDENYMENTLRDEAAFITSLGLNEEKFQQRFLQPYLDLASKNKLSFEVLTKLADMQSKVIGHRDDIIESNKQPILFKVEYSAKNYINALDWTLINVECLHLPEFEILDGCYLSEPDMPKKQCHFCGTKDIDKRGKKFNKKLRYCHAVGCVNSSIPNPEYHKKCCYGQWVSMRKTLRQRLERRSEYKPAVEKIFIEFCNKRLEENLKIENYVRTYL